MDELEAEDEVRKRKREERRLKAMADKDRLSKQRLADDKAKSADARQAKADAERKRRRAHQAKLEKQRKSYKYRVMWAGVQALIGVGVIVGLIYLMTF